MNTNLLRLVPNSKCNNIMQYMTKSKLITSITDELVLNTDMSKLTLTDNTIDGDGCIVFNTLPTDGIR